MLDTIKERCLIYCYWVGDSLKRVLVIFSVSAFAISVAVFLYGLLYWAVLPKTALNIPVKFAFNSCEISGTPCSYITSMVKFSQGKLASGHNYHLELLLEVPDTESNREVGMFLTCTRFLTEDLQERNSTTPFCTSAVIPFKPPLVSLIETLLLFPLHMAAVINSNSLVRISLLEDHQETSSPSKAIEIELQSSKLQISSGVLKIWTADLAWGLGITYNMYHHPVASMILGVALILTIICLLAALALSKFLSPQKVVVTSTPLQRNRSNHDLADRQARARLNLEYRARVDLVGKQQCIGNESISSQEELMEQSEGDQDLGRVQAPSWAKPSLPLTEAVQRLDLPQPETTPQHTKAD